MDANELELLRPYATERQIEILEGVVIAGSMRAAARALNVQYSYINATVAAVRSKAAISGVAPAHDMTHAVPAPYVVKGTSTLYGEDGRVKQQWVKTSRDEDKVAEAVQEFFRGLIEESRGLSPIVPAPAHSDDDLLCVYPMGDPHFGMYAWKDEAGADFDLDTADRMTRAAIDRLVSSAPAAKTGLIVECGDFFHADNSNSTSQSGHHLDTDTRWAKVMLIGQNAMIYVVQRALEKHQDVVVRIVKGNHDGHSHYALALGLSAFFSNNPRVTIALSPSDYWYFKFGEVLIGATHGDKCKRESLPLLMATDNPKDWGDTRYRYWYHGHIHHQDIKEFPGCIVESVRTLAARDAWHAGQGYRAGRDMCCIVHHRQYGEIERHRCDIAMIEKQAA